MTLLRKENLKVKHGTMKNSTDISTIEIVCNTKTGLIFNANDVMYMKKDENYVTLTYWTHYKRVTKQQVIDKVYKKLCRLTEETGVQYV